MLCKFLHLLNMHVSTEQIYQTCMSIVTWRLRFFQTVDQRFALQKYSNFLKFLPFCYVRATHFNTKQYTVMKWEEKEMGV